MSDNEAATYGPPMASAAIEVLSTTQSILCPQNRRVSALAVKRRSCVSYMTCVITQFYLQRPVIRCNLVTHSTPSSTAVQLVPLELLEQHTLYESEQTEQAEQGEPHWQPLT